MLMALFVKQAYLSYFNSGLVDSIEELFNKLGIKVISTEPNKELADQSQLREASWKSSAQYLERLEKFNKAMVIVASKWELYKCP